MAAYTVSGPYKVISSGNTTNNTVTIQYPTNSGKAKVTVEVIAGPIAFAMNADAALGTTGGLAATKSLSFMMRPGVDTLNFDQTANSDSFRIWVEDLI